MPEFQRHKYHFGATGFSVNAPIDRLGDKLAIADNVRSFQRESLIPRPGAGPNAFMTSTHGPINSLARLNDPSPNAVQANAMISQGGGWLMAGPYAGAMVAVSDPDTGAGSPNFFSGNQVSLVPFRPENSPEPWMYVADYNAATTKRTMVKVRANGTCYNMGIATPLTVPTATVGAAGNLTGTYFWRYTYYSTLTGAESNPSPAGPLAGLVLAAQQASVPVQASGDPQVDIIRVYRFGGTLNEWHFVGTTPNTSPFTDNILDSDITNNPLLDFDKWVPFPSMDIQRSGNCNTLGNIVTRTSGSSFNVNWPEGTVIVINGQATTVVGVQDGNTMVVAANMGTLAGVGFKVTGATLMNTNVPYLWGPLNVNGAFLFGSGDAKQAGTLYWTNGNDPDSASITGSLEVTTPTEPLMPGCMYDGRAFVFSVDRMFAIFPSATPGQFVTEEVPNSKGLFAPFGLAVGPKIWFIGKDGIYETEGGEPVSITNDDLYPLFPHDGVPGLSVNGIQIPDTTKPSKMKLSYYDGYLFFDYVEFSTGFPMTLVYDTRYRIWTRDDHFYGTSVIESYHFADVGQTVHDILYTNSTNVYLITGNKDPGNVSIVSRVKTGYQDFGDERTKKLFGDQMVDAQQSSSAFTVKIDGDYGNTAIFPSAALPSPGNRVQYILDVNSGLGTLAKNIAIDVTFGAADGQYLFGWMPSYVQKPADTLLNATDWSTDGRNGAKFVRGVVIEANTYGNARTVQVQRDGGTVVATLTVNHNGQLEQPYGFTPAVAHELRLVPTDANSWGLFGATWVWDQYPEFSTIIPYDFNDLDDPGTKHVRQLILGADTANAAVNIQVQIDGGTVAATISATHNGRQELPYAFVPPFICHNVRLVQLANCRIFPENTKWDYDKYPELSTAYSAWMDGGDPRAKYVRGIRVKGDSANAAVNLQVQIDGGTVATTLAALMNGQQEQPFGFTPFLAYLYRIVPQSAFRYFDSQLIFDVYPDLAPIDTSWTDAGYVGAKFFQGFKLKADTGNVPVTLTVQYDGGTTGATVVATHNGQERIPYTWTPFIANEVRIVPTSGIRIFDDIEWIFEPAPDLATLWKTQGVALGAPGWWHHRDAYIAMISAGVVTYSLTYQDGSVDQIFIPSTSGNYDRPYVIFPPRKCKTVAYSLSSLNPFRLFKNDCVVRFKPWGSSGPYQEAKPFGDIHAVSGARL